VENITIKCWVSGFGLEQPGEGAAGPLLGGDLAIFFALEWVGNMNHFGTRRPNFIGPPGHSTIWRQDLESKGWAIPQHTYTFWKTFLDKFLLVVGEGVLETTLINRSNKNIV
jgi:hypothetical protein